MFGFILNRKTVCDVANRDCKCSRKVVEMLEIDVVLFNLNSTALCTQELNVLVFNRNSEVTSFNYVLKTLNLSAFILKGKFKQSDNVF